MKSQRSRINLILRRLEKKQGPVTPPEQLPVLDELVATILSQNTTNKNSDAAFQELQLRFPNWERVRTAPVREVAAAIREAGLSNQKAPRIQKILEQIQQQRGELSLEFLHGMPPNEALVYLRSFHGVGPKTAACVLLFACRMPVLPVDTHVHRVSQRLGLISRQTNAEKAHEHLAREVPPQQALNFHVQLIRHGRTICTARNPKCLECVLLDRCPFGLVKLRQLHQRSDES